MLQSCSRFPRPILLRCRRYQSVAQPSHNVEAEDIDVVRRRRKSEWKRQQRGQTFLDYTVVTIRAGKGGDGCAAFHREKWKPFGPPSGGNGGRGGDVYIRPTSRLTTLSTIPKRIVAESGGHGQGSWLNGKNAPPTVIQVPIGTIVRELTPDDPRRAKDEWQAEEEGLESLPVETKKDKMRDHRWVHYPGFAEHNKTRESFLQAEKALFLEERERRMDRYDRMHEKPVKLDLDHELEPTIPVDAPLGARHKPSIGYLIASGGTGGLGNPSFVTSENRSPRYATRGQEGQRITLSLELKILADIGLVGYPNAGKSTLLKALTGGRANTEIANYPFTTLNPSIGVVRVSEDGRYEGSLRPTRVYGDTKLEGQEEVVEEEGEDSAAQMNEHDAPHLVEEDALTSGSEWMKAGHKFDIYENFRFTVADNPGLIEHASDNVGLGHSFLRSIERSHALVYVVDLSGPAPWDELAVLKKELDVYKPGMSRRARLVVANKADLLGGQGSPADIEAAQSKLDHLRAFVATELSESDGGGSPLDVIPVSAKHRQNLDRVVQLMKGYVSAARNLGPTE